MPTESTEVLIVDDSPTDAELTMHALTRNGVAPAVNWLLNAEDVDRHFARLRAPRSRARLPDLVLLEIDLPGTSGLRVLERLKTDPRTRVAPVVMFTSHTDAGIVQRCYDLGANSFVVKPSSALEYLHAVGSLTQFWLGVNYRFDSGVVEMLTRRGQARDAAHDGTIDDSPLI